MKQISSNKKIREENTSLLIRTLIKSGGMSRIELSEACGLAPSTVTQVISSLSERKLVEEYRTGSSTGGRPPVYVRIAPQYGCIVIFSIKRNGVTAEVFDLSGTRREELVLADNMLVGNTLLRAINKVVVSIMEGGTIHPANIICIGLLCQEDIPEQDLMTMYFSSAESAMMPLDVAVHSRFGIPVRKEMIERFSLDYFVETYKAPYANYAYINVGERITVCFTMDNERVELGGISTFDLNNFLHDKLLLQNVAQSRHHDIVQQREETCSPLQFAHKIAVAIRSSCTFFATDIVYVGGKAKELDKIASETTRLLEGRPPVVKMELNVSNVVDLFKSRLLLSSASTLAQQT